MSGDFGRHQLLQLDVPRTDSVNVPGEYFHAFA